MKEIKQMFTWEQLEIMKVGTVIKDWFDEGVRCLIIRGPSSLCVYLGVPMDHSLAGHDYNNIPLECHGGLTFSNQGDGEFRPKDFYWYGWDYAHFGDRSFGYRINENDKKWLVEDVLNDMWSSVYSFKILVRLAEVICQQTAVK